MRYRFEFYRPAPFIPYRYRMQVGSPPWRWRLQYDTFLRYPAQAASPLLSERVLVPREAIVPAVTSGKPRATSGSVPVQRHLATPDRRLQEARAAHGAMDGVVPYRAGEMTAMVRPALRFRRSARLSWALLSGVHHSLRQAGLPLGKLVRAAVQIRQTWSLEPQLSALRSAVQASFLGAWRALRLRARPASRVPGAVRVRRLLRDAKAFEVVQAIRRWQHAQGLWAALSLRRIAQSATRLFGAPARRVVDRRAQIEILTLAYRQFLHSAGLVVARALCRAATRQANLLYAASGRRDVRTQAWAPAELPVASRASREAASVNGLPVAARGSRTAGFRLWLRLAVRHGRDAMRALHQALASRRVRAWARLARTLLALRDSPEGELVRGDRGVYARDRVPAMILGAELATSQDLWHDIWTRFGPGLDRLPVPTRDFPYHTWWDRVLDEDGEVRPQALIGPLDGGDVEVRWPIQPLFDDVADWGTEPADVPLETLVAVMLWWRRLWLEATDEIGHLGGASALAHLLRRLRNAIAERTPADEPWQYAFRMVRWYAERTVMERGTFRLRRTFDEQGRLVSARTEPILWAKSGPDAVEYVLRLLMKYFVDHHLNKSKGLRRRWLSLRRV